MKLLAGFGVLEQKCDDASSGSTHFADDRNFSLAGVTIRKKIIFDAAMKQHVLETVLGLFIKTETFRTRLKTELSCDMGRTSPSACYCQASPAILATGYNYSIMQRDIIKTGKRGDCFVP